MTLTLTFSETASTLRPPVIASGQRGEPVEHLSALRVSRLFPVDAEQRARAGIETPGRIWQSYTAEEDVLSGDTLVLGGVEYPVRSVEEWPLSLGRVYRRLLLEDPLP